MNTQIISLSRSSLLIEMPHCLCGLDVPDRSWAKHKRECRLFVEAFLTPSKQVRSVEEMPVSPEDDEVYITPIPPSAFRAAEQQQQQKEEAQLQIQGQQANNHRKRGREETPGNQGTQDKKTVDPGVAVASLVGIEGESLPAGEGDFDSSPTLAQVRHWFSPSTSTPLTARTVNQYHMTRSTRTTPVAQRLAHSAASDLENSAPVFVNPSEAGKKDALAEAEKVQSTSCRGIGKRVLTAKERRASEKLHQQEWQKTIAGKKKLHPSIQQAVSTLNDRAIPATALKTTAAVVPTDSNQSGIPELLDLSLLRRSETQQFCTMAGILEMNPKLGLTGSETIIATDSGKLSTVQAAAAALLQSTLSAAAAKTAKAKAMDPTHAAALHLQLEANLGSVLLDHADQVHRLCVQYSLLHSTFHLSIALLHRVYASMQLPETQKDQRLLIMCVVLIASKIEEQEVKYTSWHIEKASHRAISRVCAMERDITAALQFKLSVVTPITIMETLFVAAKLNKAEQQWSCLLSDLCMYYPIQTLLKYPASAIASACVALGRQLAKCVQDALLQQLGSQSDLSKNQHQATLAALLHRGGGRTPSKIALRKSLTPQRAPAPKAASPLERQGRSTSKKAAKKAVLAAGKKTTMASPIVSRDRTPQTKEAGELVVVNGATRKGRQGKPNGSKSVQFQLSEAEAKETKVTSTATEVTSLGLPTAFLPWSDVLHELSGLSLEDLTPIVVAIASLLHQSIKEAPTLWRRYASLANGRLALLIKLVPPKRKAVEWGQYPLTAPFFLQGGEALEPEKRVPLITGAVDSDEVTPEKGVRKASVCPPRRKPLAAKQ